MNEQSGDGTYLAGQVIRAILWAPVVAGVILLAVSLPSAALIVWALGLV